MVPRLGLRCLWARAVKGPVLCVKRSHSARAFSTAASRVSASVLDALEARGFVNALTSPGVREHLAEPRSIYLGIDPSADSLHVGNLVALMALKHFQLHNHRIIALIGGATGLIGDPSGRSTERSLLSEAEVARNLGGIKLDLSKVVQFSGCDDQGQKPPLAVLVNNMDWYRPMNVITFLRDVGKHFRLSSMLSKESVKSRLESEHGLSFTEFTYQALQSYDFYHLHRQQLCTVQIGGSDQWGNITAGIDFIRRTLDREVFGVTVPLLTTASGQKFGKSAGNAVWLNERKTSAYQLYQFFYRTEDADVERFLKLFTLLPLDHISQLCREHAACTEKRLAQLTLAREVTSLVHGAPGLEKALRASKVLFGDSFLELGLKSEDLFEIFEGVPQTRLLPSDIAACIPVAELLVRCGAVRSKVEARRLITSGGLYVNGVRMDNAAYKLQSTDLVDGKVCVLRSGKRQQFVVTIQSNP